jgi:hypothetical protein
MRLVLLLALLLATLAGCGPSMVPVRGKVAFADGTPLTEGMVVCESKDVHAVAVRGQIQADGSFELSTHMPGDGVMPGKYRVLVAPKYDANAVDRPARQPPFDPRFADFATSGLELEVTAAGPNELPITLARPKKSP